MQEDKIFKIREAINVRLYSHKRYVVGFLSIASIFISICAIGAVIYQHGYPETPERLRLIKTIITFSLWFYIFKFLLRIIYDFHPLTFIKENRFEAILILFIFIDQFARAIIKSRLFGNFHSVTLGAVNGFPSECWLPNRYG